MKNQLTDLNAVLDQISNIITILLPFIFGAWFKIKSVWQKYKIQNNLKNKADNDLQIKEELERLLEKIYADRCYTFMFHNGTKGVDNIGWYYMDCRHEVTREDVTSMASCNQNIPCSNYPEVLQKIMRNEIVEVVDIYDEKFKKNNKQFQQQLRTQMVNAVICMPICKKGEVVGYLAVDYVYSSDLYKYKDADESWKFKEDIIHKVCESLGVIKNLI